MSLAHLLRPIHIARLKTAGNLFLAPVAGYSDRAFRSLCVEEGASLTCTELISAEALVRDSKKTAAMLGRADNEKVYAIQLFGNNSQQLYRASCLLADYGPDVLDLNCGCPVPKVVKAGAGSALLKDLPRLGSIVEAMVRASQEKLGNIPVTVKIRAGWDESSINFLEAARVIKESGAALIGFHARTRAQGYTGLAKHQWTGELVASSDLPIVASGDVFSPEAAANILSTSSCAGVMFARGAMGNPFIFRETIDYLTKGSWTAVSAPTRLAAGFGQLKLLAQDVGEEHACREMRKHFCAYTRGLAGGAALRNALVRANTIEEYKLLLAPFCTDI